MSDNISFPPQQIPYSKKNKEWRKKICDWADQKTFFNYSLVRKSVLHKKINYDLINGKLHMSDLQMIINPDGIEAGYIPDSIQHYPIINSKLNVLRGEESSRVFDYRVVVTNPNAISEIEEKKQNELVQRLQELVASRLTSKEEINQKLEELNDYFTYKWQDEREIRANALLNHYIKEYNIPQLFNQGFMDAMIAGEEMYQCDIVGGEPVINKLNPLKVRVFKSGYSNKIEDADIVILEDYWSPGKIIDTFYDVLTPKDIKYIEELPNKFDEGNVDSMDNIDDRAGLINNYMIGDEITSQEGFFWDPNGTQEGINNSLLPYDLAGNVRVLRVYWKSRRRIKKVKSYNKQTGETEYNFYPESHVINEDEGEEEEIFYVNEAWEGTKIGEQIYVQMKQRDIQYNRLSNPSRCHFGIIGNIYNLNDSRPFSLVDMMKPYSYQYDVIHDRLDKALANNWGAIMDLDLAKVPKGWDIDKWLYYAKVTHLRITDSFKEGNVGTSTGKLAGALNNASSGGMVLDQGNFIQQLINLLEFIKGEMSEVAGISKQREGQISNRETVGGVERATLQSSHITEWLFFTHDDIKKRVLECFLETAKIAMKGFNKKFQYLLSDGSTQLVNIQGDEFSENDYGLVVDNSNAIQNLYQKMDALTQAAVQNQYNLSVIMKLYSSASLAEKQRMLEAYEKKSQQQAQEQQQQQLQAQQEQAQMQKETAEEEMKLRDTLNQRDNDVKLMIARIQATSQVEDDGIQTPEWSEEARATHMEKMREFDQKLNFEKEKLQYDKQKTKKDQELKEKQINKMHKSK